MENQENATDSRKAALSPKQTLAREIPAQARPCLLSAPRVVRAWPSPYAVKASAISSKGTEEKA